MLGFARGTNREIHDLNKRLDNRNMESLNTSNIGNIRINFAFLFCRPRIFCPVEGNDLYAIIFENWSLLWDALLVTYKSIYIIEC